MSIQMPLVAAPVLQVARQGGLQAWSVGQLLDAEVIDGGGENYTSLRIGARTVTASGGDGLVPGQALRVRVAAVGETIVLKVLPGASSGGDARAAVLDQALARTLPRQASRAEAQALFAGLVDAARGRASAPAAPLPAAATAALRALPAAAALTTPASLARALDAAATPTEARLANLGRPASPDTLTSDLRVVLAGVRDAVVNTPHAPPRLPVQETTTTTTTARPPHDARRPAEGAAGARESTPPTTNAVTATGLGATALSDLVDGVIARLEAHQIANAQQATTTAAPGFGLELPILRGDTVDWLSFDYTPREGAGDTADGPAAMPGRATVTLRLDLGDGLAFQARVHLLGDGMSVRLGSPDLDYNEALAEHREELAAAMAAHGLELAELVVAPLEATAALPRRRAPLIDTRA